DALLVLVACVPVPPGTEEGKEEDRRRSQVVLERVGEEERTHAECDQGQFQTEPAQQARVATDRQGHACGGAPHDGEDRQRGDKDSDEDEHPDQPAPDVFAERATNPGLLGWIGVLLRAAKRKTHPGLSLFRSSYRLPSGRPRDATALLRGDVEADPDADANCREAVTPQLAGLGPYATVSGGRRGGREKI